MLHYAIGWLSASLLSLDIMPKRLYETEDEEGPPTADQHLSWRVLPEESHSDWTIEISKPGNNSGEGMAISRVFHVHKNILSVGPKKSNYFARLFQNGQCKEHQTNTSSIALDAIAADSFPLTLDYLYSPSDKLEISTSNATTLHYLAGYFEIQRLQWEAFQFCRRDMKIENCHTYCEHARLFHQDNVTKLVAKKCFEKLDDISLDSALLEVSDSTLWTEVIRLIRDGRQAAGWSSDSEDTKRARSLALSLLIARFCQLQPEAIDAETFTHLTGVTHMTVVASGAALPLLQTEDSLLPKSDASKLSCLQSRCVEALVSSWETMDYTALSSALSELSFLVFSSVFTKAFEEAKEKAATVESQAKETVGRLKEAESQAKNYNKRAKAAEARAKQAERQMVQRLQVKGAKLEKVNDWYDRKLHRLYDPFFRGRGEANGCRIFCSKDKISGKMRWWICQERSMDDSDDDDYFDDYDTNVDGYNCFYYAEHPEGGLQIPPQSGWKALCGRRVPALALFFGSNDNEDFSDDNSST